MIQLYGFEISGNSYKVRLLLALLGLNYEWISVDLKTGAQKSPEFLALNPFGQVPVLVDGDAVWADAQAILVYLARQYGGDRWLPLDTPALTQVLRWLFITAGEVRQGPESARLFYRLKVANISIERATQKSEFILTQLDQHLRDREWLELGHVTIADVAVFPYISLAPDG
jgi:glutathione S-transferase